MANPKFKTAYMEFHYTKDGSTYVVTYRYDSNERCYKTKVIGPGVLSANWRTSGQPNKTNAANLIRRAMQPETPNP